MKKVPKFCLAMLAVVILFVSCSKDPEPEPAPLALSVSNVTPANNAANVAITTTVSIDFSRSIDGKTISGVSLLKGQSIVSTTAISSGSSVTLTPSAPLENNVIYTVISKGVKATDGGVSPDFTSTFTTAKSPIIVESITPADKATGIKTDAKIIIKFNKKPNSTTQLGSTISLIDRDGKTVELTYVFDGTSSVTCTPKEAMFSSETYKVAVKGVVAEDGGVSTDVTYSFVVEKVPFKIVSIVPVDQTKGVSINAKVIITFSKKLNTKTATGTEFILAGMNTPTSSNVTYDGKYTITMTPTVAMKKATIYSGFISNLSSEDGDVIKSESFSFTTEN